MLRIFLRSNAAYSDMRQDGSLGALPHPRTMTNYKNQVKQCTGINREFIKWMGLNAEKKCLPSHGWKGGLIIDETSIQVSNIRFQ